MQKIAISDPKIQARSHSVCNFSKQLLKNNDFDIEVGTIQIGKEKYL
ncbi:hypothetical protein ACF3DV_26340 [Chlorogloeopsis fritschii PCC 9212]|nr:hypothetical protein [Chlorogloeopsis fritschii]